MARKINRKDPSFAVGTHPKFKLGRMVVKDRRDGANLMSAGVSKERWELPTLPRFGWPVKWRGNQGQTQRCTGFSLTLAMRALPFPHVHYGPDSAYLDAKRNDAWPGEAYEGSSVRGAAKGAQKRGEVVKYRWCYNVDDLKRGIRWLGVALVGSDWLMEMYEPTIVKAPQDHPRTRGRALIRARGAVDGGHAFPVSEYDDSMFGGAFLIPNSWKDWGHGCDRNPAGVGNAWIPYDDMAMLLSHDGEACALVKYETDGERGHGDTNGDE